jgi:uncharacterized protein
MRRITAILALVVAATVFAAWTFTHLAHLAGWPWIVLPALVTASFVPTVFLSHRVGNPLVKAVNVASGISIGFLSFFLLAAIAAWLAVGALRLAGILTDPSVIVFACYGAAALAALFALFNASLLRITRVTVPLRNLPSFWSGRSLALVSDIHLGNFRGAGFSRKVVSSLMGLGAECILVAGDMFDGVRIDAEKAAGPWAALSAPSGVFFVGGNHDEYGDREAYLGALRRSGMRVLDNERVDIHGLQLAGVHDLEIHEPEPYRRLLEGLRLDPTRASVLLAHRPSNLSVPEKAGIGLQLSGHTHQGQFWPWTLVAGRVHGKFTYGLNPFGRMLVYTSSGAGTWGPPFRLGTRSEIVLIRLEAAREPG